MCLPFRYFRSLIRGLARFLGVLGLGSTTLSISDRLGAGERGNSGSRFLNWFGGVCKRNGRVEIVEILFSNFI